MKIQTFVYVIIYIFFTSSFAEKLNTQEKTEKDIQMVIYEGDFGTCCKQLQDAMNQPPNSLIFVEENGVLYLTVGYVQTEKGPGFFDQAIIFYPFCGKKLQDKDEIAKKSKK